MTTERCIDGSPHQFVFLRQTVTEKSWHNYRTEDLYFCQKCLTQQAVEVQKKEERRW